MADHTRIIAACDELLHLIPDRLVHVDPTEEHWQTDLDFAAVVLSYRNLVVASPQGQPTEK